MKKKRFHWCETISYYLVSSLDLRLRLSALFPNLSWRTGRSWQTCVTLCSCTDMGLKQSRSGDNSSGTGYPPFGRREWLVAGRTHTLSPLGPWKFKPMFPWGQITQHCGIKQLHHLSANGNYLTVTNKHQRVFFLSITGKISWSASTHLWSRRARWTWRTLEEDTRKTLRWSTEHFRNQEMFKLS